MLVLGFVSSFFLRFMFYGSYVSLLAKEYVGSVLGRVCVSGVSLFFLLRSVSMSSFLI